MSKYDYRKALKSDIENHVKENNIDLASIDLDDADDFYDLYDSLWLCDDVTGNASGSYTLNTWQAEENLAHNWELLSEAMEAFGFSEKPIEKGAEHCDVMIRCYLLGEVLCEVIKDVNREIKG